MTRGLIRSRIVDFDGDTIAAPATAPGAAGVAVIRVSGPAALAVLARVFRAANGIRPDRWPPRRLMRGTVVDPETSEALDDALAVTMIAPRSFTGEDVAEIHTHGGHATVTAVLAAVMAARARAAAPGEFSRRAFLNGKMDMAEAESLADLVSASCDRARRAALAGLRGGLGAALAGIRADLIDAGAQIEAHLDFPDDDIPAPAHAEIRAALSRADDALAALLETFRRGRIVREGARVVLRGAPNAGKSSLFNALVGRDRALVSPHPGTTRDTIEATVELDGYAVTLIDTAGMRETDDEVERMGVERSRDEAAAADVVVTVIDGPASGADPATWPMDTRTFEPGAGMLVAWNKADQAEDGGPGFTATPERSSVIAVSATTRSGLDRLCTEIVSRLHGGSGGSGDGPGEAILTRARHAECVSAARESLGLATLAFDQRLSGEFPIIDLRQALAHLAEVTGEGSSDEILDRVFATFCLGK